MKSNLYFVTFKLWSTTDSANYIRNNWLNQTIQMCYFFKFWINKVTKILQKNYLFSIVLNFSMISLIQKQRLLTGTAIPSYSNRNCGLKCKIWNSVRKDGSGTYVTSWCLDLGADLPVVALSLDKNNWNKGKIKSNHIYSDFKLSYSNILFSRSRP